eukprot:14950505-Ditylum_brightwellii.AAC.1
MDILENAMPNFCQEEMCHQRFDCAAKGQAEFISFCQNLEFLDPLKDKKVQNNSTKTSSTVISNNWIPKRNGAETKLLTV